MEDNNHKYMAIVYTKLKTNMHDSDHYLALAKELLYTKTTRIHPMLGTETHCPIQTGANIIAKFKVDYRAKLDGKLYGNFVLYDPDSICIESDETIGTESGCVVYEGVWVEIQAENDQEAIAKFKRMHFFGREGCETFCVKIKR